MVEIDSDTYQVKRMAGENIAPRLRFLITPGRLQNLELLRHLLENTDQSIVLCGPDGVGKTSMLKVLQKKVNDELRWCAVTGSAGLSFEEIHERIGPFLRHHRHDLHAKNFVEGHVPEHSESVVLVIDDAGKLHPGLAKKLIQLAQEQSDLRIIFALTHDQWHIKNCSDPEIESCYIVEMKPLDCKECRDFVKHLSSLTYASRFRNTLTDSMIDLIFLETHGIPSKILARFPEFNKSKESTDPLILLVLAVLALVFLALGVQWFTATRPGVEKDDSKALSRLSQPAFDLNPPFLSLPIGNGFESKETTVLSATQKIFHDVAPQNRATIEKETDGKPSTDAYSHQQ